MRRGIRMQFRERLADDKNKIEETKEKPATLIKVYICYMINVILLYNFNLV